MSARRSRRYRRRGALGLNMTPMVDVVLVILIFFMGAMGLAAAEQYLGTGAPPPEGAEQSAAPSTQPAPSAAPASRAILRLTVSGGRTVVNGLGLHDITIATVADRLDALVKAGFDSSVIVVVAPAREVPYQDVVLVHDAAARAGITNIRLGVSSDAAQ